MGSLKSRLEIVEDIRKRGEAQLSREALTYLSDDDLDALEDVVVAREEDPSASSEEPLPPDRRARKKGSLSL